MATYAAGAVGVYEKTLVADTADTVTFSDWPETIEVLSDGDAAIYVRVDGTAPAVGGGDSWYIPAGGMFSRTIPIHEDNAAHEGGLVVKLISAGTPTYSVNRTEI